MRPLTPLPLTSASGTPSSRAKRRTDGEACGRWPVGAVGSWAGSAAVGSRRSTGWLASAAGAAGALVVAGAAVGAAAGAGAAPAAAFSTTTGVPLDTLSPSLTSSRSTTPACDDGISIEALSLSTVIRLCSAATVSPGLTSSSITATSSKSPMSGTTTSIVAAPPPDTGAGAAGPGAGAAAGAAAGVGAAAAAPAAVSSTSTSVPSLTLSPSATLISFTTPAWLDGISIEALSLSTVTRLCSALIVSPAFTSTSITST